MNNILYILFILYCTLGIQYVHGWGSTSHKKILLRDVSSLTLYDGKMTNGRRSSPVPQLECANEGSASCYDFKPKIVQCTNRGSDGVDAQWECKGDMNSGYKFGFIEVTCEGYDYPDDPYILAGSCGLKYTLDHDAGGSDYSREKDYYGSSYSSYKKSSMSTTIANIISYAVIALMIYAFYKTCFSSTRNVGENAYSTTSDDDPSDNRGGGYGWFGGDNSSTHHRSSSSYNDDASCGSRGTNRGRQGGGSGLGGFWTGAATGGLLAYMFGGNRNTHGYGNQGYGGRNYGYGGRSYGSGGMFSGGGSYGSSGGFSGSRTSTGFGGTSRR